MGFPGVGLIAVEALGNGFGGSAHATVAETALVRLIARGECTPLARLLALRAMQVVGWSRGHRVAGAATAESVRILSALAVGKDAAVRVVARQGLALLGHTPSLPSGDGEAGSGEAPDPDMETLHLLEKESHSPDGRDEAPRREDERWERELLRRAVDTERRPDPSRTERWTAFLVLSLVFPQVRGGGYFSSPTGEG